jgi:hypothetical protein
MFVKIGAIKSTVFAYWSMSNGASFWFAIPETAKIGDDTFTNDVEFPFVFSEICSLEIPRSRGKGEFEFRNDLESIAALFPIHGLLTTVSGDRIIITVQEEP